MSMNLVDCIDNEDGNGIDGSFKLFSKGGKSGRCGKSGKGTAVAFGGKSSKAHGFSVSAEANAGSGKSSKASPSEEVGYVDESMSYMANAGSGKSSKATPSDEVEYIDGSMSYISVSFADGATGLQSKAKSEKVRAVSIDVDESMSYMSVSFADGATELRSKAKSEKIKVASIDTKSAKSSEAFLDASMSYSQLEPFLPSMSFAGVSALGSKSSKAEMSIISSKSSKSMSYAAKSSKSITPLPASKSGKAMLASSSFSSKSSKETLSMTDGLDAPDSASNITADYEVDDKLITDDELTSSNLDSGSKYITRNTTVGDNSTPAWPFIVGASVAGVLGAAFLVIRVSVLQYNEHLV